ncbi:hypothetical protein L1987_34173 [Smallanthus sonchifolius]|uniref:Uncharacterized protein n=1 Tax=Smallanthus sonchifolius TaxID=185202 RepID=A0ACB9HT42_9ASTR|nr:hypothetical protein L1987_34173 [Smallanthus sonchifolius]
MTKVTTTKTLDVGYRAQISDSQLPRYRKTRPGLHIHRRSSKPLLRLVAANKKSISPLIIYHQIVLIHQSKHPIS